MFRSPKRRDGRSGRHLRRAATLGAGWALCLVLAGPALAADPTPAPVVFGTPQLLVWWDGHGTSNGPVVDNKYALIRPDQVDPADATHFILVDASGLSYHYSGHVVSGPYAGSTDLCPVMLSVGIDYLSAYPYTDAVGFSAVDCRALLHPATAAPTAADLPLASAAATAGAGAIVTSGDGASPRGGSDPLPVGLAAAGILALFGVGSLAIFASVFGWGPFASPGPAPITPGMPGGPGATVDPARGGPPPTPAAPPITPPYDMVPPVPPIPVVGSEG